MRTAGLLIGLILTVIAFGSTRGSASACDRGSQLSPAAAERLEGKVAALLMAEVASPSADPASLGVTLLVRTEDRLVTVAVIEGAQILSSDGAALTADAIQLASTVLLTGRWTGDETFEAIRVELL